MREGEKIDSNSWMVTFADLVMLLLTFFVLLLSMSSMDAKKLEDIVSHFRAATGVLGFSDKKEEVSDLASFIRKYNDNTDLLVIDQNKLIYSMELSESLKELLKNQNQKIIDLTDDERGIVLSFHKDILFDSGKATIKKEAFPILDTVADAIDECPNDILIMGHTDDISIKSNLYKSNWELSSYRGLSVLEYFIKEKRISPSRFSVGGYGPSRPLYPNNTPENRALNRRIEIIFKHLQGE